MLALCMIAGFALWRALPVQAEDPEEPVEIANWSALTSNSDAALY